MSAAKKSEAEVSDASRAPPSLDPLALIHKKQLAQLLGVRSWTINYWRKKHWLPPPIHLSPQIVAWRRSDVERWLIERELQPIPFRSSNPHGRKRRAAAA
jgi:predicted DNA-binding transcriptional regulator AlpA